MSTRTSLMPPPQTRHPSWPMAPSFSSFSVLALGVGVAGRVLFPGREHMPATTVGYVRSDGRAQLARALGSSFYSPYKKLPWRDYPDEALTPTDLLIAAPYEHHSVVISARNTLNEWGYQLRLSHDWLRRYDDAAIDPDWPVLSFGDGGVSIIRLNDAKQDDNLVTGIPLVIEGRPSDRDFLIACCSDVAHVFDVNPKGQRGPSADAWRKLSNLWQTLKDRGLDDSDLAALMEEEATRLTVSPSRDLLHSVLAQRYDGVLIAFAITGALTDIAIKLAQRWDVQHSLLLDNGGSVGWQALLAGAETPRLLVSGPNHRLRGTAFLVLELSGFLHPHSHPLLEL